MTYIYFLAGGFCRHYVGAACQNVKGARHGNYRTAFLVKIRADWRIPVEIPGWILQAREEPGDSRTGLIELYAVNVGWMLRICRGGTMLHGSLKGICLALQREMNADV